MTATDTGVGKTVVSTLLMGYFLEKGLSPVYLKPFQTGCSSVRDRESDALFVYSHLPGIRKLEAIDERVCYVFSPPRAPYFAALKEGREIDWKYCIRWIEENSEGWDVCIIEGAGGLMVPVTKDRLMIDLIGELQMPVLLVARPSLGTINHTLLSLQVLQMREIPLLGVCFSLSSWDIDPDFVEENKEAISMFSPIDVDIVPYYRDLSSIKSFPCFFDELFLRLEKLSPLTARGEA